MHGKKPENRAQKKPPITIIDGFFLPVYYHLKNDKSSILRGVLKKFFIILYVKSCKKCQKCPKKYTIKNAVICSICGTQSRKTVLLCIFTTADPTKR